MGGAFRNRWVHAFNTREPWTYVDKIISEQYDQFRPIPWFIGEYGANSQNARQIRLDLQAMDRRAKENGDFIGATFYQFQTEYTSGGLAKNFGMFALGSRVVGQTKQICDRSIPCGTWPVHCLTTDLTWLPGTKANRAAAVADAWGGDIGDSLGLCSHTRAIATTANPIVITTPAMTRMPSVRPLRGISYSAMPCTGPTCGGHGLPSKDLLQAGYEVQWGESGRDDLGMMKKLGANTVRLYHSFGLYGPGSYAGFLDRASEVGLSLMPGYDTMQVLLDGECPEFDCFETWKAATLHGFENGFQQGSDWHSAVSTLVLMNEPDSFEQYAKCKPHGSWCRVKAVLSAMDGVLAAEREAGVSPGKVKLAVTWSFASKASIDGKVSGPGIFGFQDMVAGIADPQIAKYSPRTSMKQLEEAFRNRWVHAFNTRSPWYYVDKIVSEQYAKFRPIPWFIGEYGANGQTKAQIRIDLEAMDRRAQDGGDFLGTTFYQFQSDYQNGGLAKNFGLFALSGGIIGQTGQICDQSNPCASWPVHCLSTDLSWLPGSQADRAAAVADAWGGRVGDTCRALRRLEEGAGTKLVCQINTDAVSGGAETALTLLSTASFEQKIRARTTSVLGDESSALRGELHVQPHEVVKPAYGIDSTTKPHNVDSTTEALDETNAESPGFPTWILWGLVAVVAALVSAGTVAVCFLVRGRKTGRQSEASTLSAHAV